MKKKSVKLTALVCCAAVVMSLAGCFGGAPRHSGRETDKGNKIENGYSEPTYSTDPTTDPTSDPSTVPSTNPTGGAVTADQLTYPDHVATNAEVHPDHAPGTVSGNDAVKLLSEVEYEILHHEITSYADVEILFEDPSKFGFDIKEATWGEFTTIDQYPAEKQYYQQQLKKLLTINYNSLQGDDRLCYDKLVYDLEETIYGYSYTAFEYYTMIFNFLVGPQCDVLFVLDVYTFDTVEDAEKYIELVKDIDRYYDLMCKYEETRARLGFASSDDSYEEAAKSFDNLVKQKDDCFLYESFEERLDNIKGLSASDKSRLISAHEKAMKEVAFPEFEECARRMRNLKGSGGKDQGLCEYKGGDAYYAMLTRLQTNNPVTVQESIDALDNRIKYVYDDMIKIMTSGTNWYSEYEDHEYSKGSLEQNLDFLRTSVKSDFPEIPPHEYYTMDVPKVFEENFSPAAYLGFHLDNFNANLIIINQKSADADKDFGVTVAHEAYPGHMFQSLYTRSHTNHPYMYLSASIGYSEGWAVYVENYSMRYFSGSGVTEATKLVSYEAELQLLISTRVDYGIHVENWSLKQCVDYFRSFKEPVLGKSLFSVTEKSFKKFYTLLVTDPGYYAKYGMGYLWTQQTMDDMRAKFPNKTDKDIHTAYLDSLTGTFPQIRKNMEKRLG